MSLLTGAKLENEALHARLVFIVGVIMAVTFAIMVIGLLFGMLFVNMPAELSPMDGSIVDLLSTISVFLTGALSGLVASNGIKKIQRRTVKPYTVNAAPVTTGPLAGMDIWITRAIKHSDGCLWNNGSWVVRDVRGKPGIVSNHAKGVAVDLSYRMVANVPGKAIYMGRQRSLAYLIKLLENADTLGIQLVIDYALNRTWKCDRAAWRPGTYHSGDWYHIEVDPVMCHSAELAKQAWDKVFGVIPQVTKKPV